MSQEPITGTEIIKAEDAPLGVLLWPADSEALLPHHTLELVEVVQSVRSLVGDHGPFVRWAFVSRYDALVQDRRGDRRQGAERRSRTGRI
jgi:hypothetical protein